MALAELARSKEGLFKTEFEIPTRLITVADLRTIYDSCRGGLEADLASVGNRIAIRWGFPQGANGQGETFVYFGKLLEGLNGTWMSYQDFVSAWEVVLPKGLKEEQVGELLKGDGFTTTTRPLIVLRSPEGMMTLNVFGGATHLAARILSEIGTEGNFEEEKRRRYQSILAFLYKPLVLRNSGNFGPLEIVSEDCLATADTFIGWEIASRKAAEANGLVYPFSGSRWDLVEATAQGLILAACEVDYLTFPTEINVVFIQAGLTEGIGPKQEHKNYITPSPELVDAYDGRIFAVGDMGDAAQRVGGVAWDQYRQDNWGMRGGENFWSRNLENSGSLLIGFANGGLLMMALRDRVLEGSNQLPTIMLTGKRVDGPCFAARFDHFMDPYLEYLRQHQV